MVLLGIISILSISIFTNLLSNPQVLLKDQAVLLMSEEINQIEAGLSVNDTIYFNERKNLIVNRTLRIDSLSNKVMTVVIYTSKDTVELLRFSNEIY